MMFVAPYCETQMPILSSLAFDDIGEPQWHVRYRHVQRWLEGVSVSSVWDCERLPYESMESLYLLVDLDSSLAG